MGNAGSREGSQPRPRALPAGTRDVLPDEMRELRAITRAIVDVLDRRGYGEIRSPALEFERSGPGQPLSPESPYRLIDEHGEALALRSDMTVPIAMIAATRYRDVDPPLRFSYLSRTWRRVERGTGAPREFLQAGAELLGAEGESGPLEILDVVAEVLEAAGLREWRIGIGDAGLMPELIDALGYEADEKERLLAAIGGMDLAGFSALAGSARSGTDLGAVARTRIAAADHAALTGSGGASAPLAASAARVADLARSLPPGLAERTIIDLGLTATLGYYGGIVFEIFDPAVGRPIGSGGSYDRLLEWAGRPMPAIGFALDVEAVHAAIAGEERGERSAGVPAGE